MFAVGRWYTRENTQTYEFQKNSFLERSWLGGRFGGGDDVLGETVQAKSASGSGVYYGGPDLP